MITIIKLISTPITVTTKKKLPFLCVCLVKILKICFCLSSTFLDSTFSKIM